LYGIEIYIGGLVLENAELMVLVRTAVTPSRELGLHCRDVMEPANIRIRQMRISCAKSVGFGCGFVARSKLPAIMATVIQLIYLKLSSCKRSSSEQLK